MTRARILLIAVMGALVVGGAAYLSLSQPARQPPPADLVLRGGRIVTLDDQHAEAQALAACDGRIVAVGSIAEISDYIGSSTQVIELNGQFAMPGFIEGHGHFTGLGENKINLDLLNTTSWDQIVQTVAQAVEKAKPGQWIIGRGWHQEKWTSTPQPGIEGFPTHPSLDAVSPNNPVVLSHASGHASFVNRRAMELSTITRTTPNPGGGEILKDSSGNPTGLLRETASGLVRQGAGEPVPTAEEAEARARQVLELADQEVISKGITSFQDAGSPYEVIDRMKRMVGEGAMRVRLWVLVREELMKAGAIVNNGTDAPVEDVDPILNYYAAVTRKVSDGSVFYGAQTMNRMDALRSYTINNAFAAFEDDIKGTLSVGKLADITVLTKDITTVPDEEITQTKVAYTIIGGSVAYKGQ